MKHQKILVSVSMLLLSALLLSSASFAWFSMNTDVQVNGIEFEAHSDSLFLQVSENGTAFQAEDITFQNEPQKALRPIAYGTLEKLGGAYSIVMEEVTEGNYTQAIKDAGTQYYKIQEKASTNDTKVGAGVYDYINVTKTLDKGTDVGGKYILGDGIKFVPNTDAAYAGTLYKKVNNDYVVYTPGVGETKLGYYCIEGSPSACASGTSYSGAKQYYNRENNGDYTLVSGFDEGTPLKGLYVVTATAEGTPTVGSTYHFTNSDGDYIAFNVKDESSNGLDGYWYRGYSENTNMANRDGQAGNISGVITNMDVENSDYILADKIYLRMAEGSANAKNLRISDITIKGSDNNYALTKAIRVAFVAKSSVTGEQVAALIYNNVDGTIERLDGVTDETLICSALVGNTGEVIEVSVYIFYDGTHESVASSNNLNLSGHSFSVSFEIDKPYYAD